ncbi:MAG TPA: histidine phosphatase family protein [Mycobacteriales bacterium]|nr:histidine phosphatase family protein [Mycobacteriales bacterium]
MNIDGLFLELVPHCASVSRNGWAADHSVRPLSPLGHEQARALVTGIGTDVAAVYSSPTLRCRQTVAPLSDATHRSVEDLPELIETDDFAEPAEWIGGVFAPIAEAIRGAWAAGRGLRALRIMADRHRGQRIVAASHGDIIPALLATLCAGYDLPLPGVVPRGGWYTIRIGTGQCTIEARTIDSPVT